MTWLDEDITIEAKINITSLKREKKGLERLLGACKDLPVVEGAREKLPISLTLVNAHRPVRCAEIGVWGGGMEMVMLLSVVYSASPRHHS